MKIRFETTFDDYLAFVTFQHAEPPAELRRRRKLTLALPVVIGVMMLLYWFGFRRPAEPIIPPALYCPGMLALAAIRWYFFYFHWFQRWTMKQNARKLLAGGSRRILLGWREMELVNRRLVLQADLVRSSLDLDAIEKIVTTEQFTFVYIPSMSAYIIPMNRFPEAEHRQFVAELRAAWENRDIAPPAPEAPTLARPDERIMERPN